MGKFKLPTFVKKPKVIWSIIFLLMTVSIILLVVHNLNAPAVGSISQTPPEKAEKLDPYAEPGNYKDKYISFTYPAHYKKAPSPLSGNLLDSIIFQSTGTYRKQIAIGVTKENINNDSGIKLRRSNPSVYTEESRNSTGIVMFNSTVNGSERTAFVPHADKVATVSITAGSGWDLTEDMQTIVSSLKWQ